jgi:hypothetical protein
VKTVTAYELTVTVFVTVANRDINLDTRPKKRRVNTTFDFKTGLDLFGVIVITEWRIH